MRFVIADVGHHARRVSPRHVRRVRDDHVEQPHRRLEQVADQERHPIRNVERAGIPAGYRDRRGRDVGHLDVPCRPFAGERQAEGATARPHVHDTHEPACRDTLQGVVDDELGLGPRNEDVRVDEEVAAVELARPDDVGHRFARRAARDQHVEGREEFGRGRLVGARDPGGAIPLQDVAREHLGVEVGVALVQAGREQAGPGGSDGATHGQASTASVRLASFSSSER